MLGSACDPPIPCFACFFADIKEVNNFRSFERSELERKLSLLAIAVIPGETKVMLSACDVA